ncbi:peptidoglycan DD-metalloendopeptidase family protein [Mesobacillus foraminis]|uniref:peptidoglycan DD-metalloendopeptidase family protein n=1 Tax=Mesobacillus foraminis TaxID=279826 RepID=UPI001BE88649|nr:peptidoglycan DD-metalloendopeptidase family protein [Mesobacillus foraminis]MBT2756635.1 peptidoglycan DD-metalloendopeptidase family protein [Mesobacillus foraminis]
MREEKSSQDKSFKRFFKKRWVYPTAYLASAAIILTGVLWYQNSGEEKDQFATEVPGKKINQEPAVEVNRSLENFVMPVKDAENTVIKTQFYDNDSDKAEQEAALVVYNNQYHPNTGVDIAAKDEKDFDVIASLSGTVTVVKEDSLLGNVIEIEHDNGIVTQYQSIKNMKVKAGDKVEQGQAIATSGTSLFNEEAGNHVHFEIRKDNVPVNPLDYFDKPLSSLEEAAVSPESNSGKDEAGTESSDPAAEDGAATEEGTTPAEDAEEGTPAEDNTSTEEGTPADETSTEEGTPAEDETSTEEGTPSDDASTEEGTPSDDKKSTEEDTEQDDSKEDTGSDTSTDSTESSNS